MPLKHLVLVGWKMVDRKNLHGRIQEIPALETELLDREISEIRQLLHPLVTDYSCIGNYYQDFAILFRRRLVLTYLEL